MKKLYMLLFLFALIPGCTSVSVDLTNYNRAKEEGVWLNYDPRFNVSVDNIYALLKRKEDKWDFVSFIEKPKSSGEIKPPFEVLVISFDGRHVQPKWHYGTKKAHEHNKNLYEYVFTCSSKSDSEAYCRKYAYLGEHPDGYARHYNPGRYFYAVSQARVANAYYGSGLKNKIDECIEKRKKLDTLQERIKVEHNFTDKSGLSLTNDFNYVVGRTKRFTCGTKLEEYALSVTGKMLNEGLDRQGKKLEETVILDYSETPEIVSFEFEALRAKYSVWAVNKVLKGKELDLNLISIYSPADHSIFKYKIINNSNNFIDIEKFSVAHGGKVVWEELSATYPPNSKSDSEEYVSLLELESLIKILNAEEAKTEPFDLEISLQYKSNGVTQSSVYKLTDPYFAFLSN